MSSPLGQLDAQLSGSRWARCEPPRSTPSSLRAWLSFETPLGLQRGLEALSPLCLAPELKQALLQVIYRPDLLSLSAARLHKQFQEAHPRCSTYLPLCLPLPQTEELRRWASPENCGACIFLEGGRCDGLGPRQAAPTARGAELSGAGALRDPWGGGHLAQDQGWFEGLPLAYWRPSEALKEELADLLMRLDAQVMWDLGAGNGALGEALCPPSIKLVSVEPLDVYSLPPRALHWRGDASAALEAALRGELPRPDCLLISWPPPTESFRALIEALRPRLILRATDRAGFCGARSGHRALWWREGSAPQWWRPADCHDGYDDLSPPLGYQLISSREVESLYDARNRLPKGERQGLFVIHQAQSCSL